MSVRNSDAVVPAPSFSRAVTSCLRAQLLPEASPADFDNEE